MEERSSSEAAPGRVSPVLSVSLRLRALAYITLAIAAALGVIAVFRPAGEAVTRIALGVLLALALDPLVRALQRRGLRRRWAAAVVGFAVLVAGALVIAVMGPQTVEQAGKFEEELPETVQGFYDLPVVGDWLEENDAAARLENFVADLPNQLDDETVADTADSLLGGLVSTIIVLAVAFAVMIDGENLVGRARRLIPGQHRERADDIGRVLYRTFGNYFSGSITVAVMMGLYVLVLGLVFGVPLAPVAAIWAMITDLVPQIGGFLGGSFVTVLALSVSVPVAIAVCLLFVMYMNFENHVIQPAVIGDAVDLSPPATMMAALVGGAAAGVPGALVATPVVGSVKRLYFEFFGDGEPEPDAKPSFADRIRGLVHRSEPESAT